MRSELPEELDADYELVRLLGMGASGSVHLATQRATGRAVAIKLMRLAGSRSATKRFEREAENLARLTHPALVEHLDHGLVGDDAYLITEYIQGNSLKESTAGVDPQGCMLQVAGALDVLHEAGLIHRDVKPANIMVTPEGRAVLLDLGLVVDPARTRITRTGSLPGTMNFLPQEVLHGAAFSAAADWYAWGVTYYFLREGRHPFRSVDVFAAAEGRPLPPLQLEAVSPRSSEGWLLRAACHPDPTLRPTSAEACRRILEGDRPNLESPVVPPQAMAQSTVRARSEQPSRRPFLLGGLFLATAMGLAAVVLRPDETPPPTPAPPTPAVASATDEAPVEPTRPEAGSAELPPEIPPEEIPPWLEFTSQPVAAGLQKMILTEALGFRLCPVELVPGERLLFNGPSGDVGLLDLRRGAVVGRLEGPEGAIQSLDLGPDARWAVVGGDDTRVRKISVPELEVLRDVDGGDHPIFAVATSHDGTSFAAAGDSPEVRVWDSQTGELLHRLTGHASRVISLAYQPDDRRLYAGGLAGVIRVWDLETGRAVARLPSDGRTVATMTFDSPGERLVAGYLDGNVRVFDVASGEKVATLEGHTQHLAAVRFAPLDREIYTAAWDGDLRIWRGDTYEPLATLEAGEARLMGMAATSYTVDLATLDDAGMVRLWSPQSRQQTAAHELRTGEVQRTASARGTDTGGDRLVGVAVGPERALVTADVAGAVFLPGSGPESPREIPVELSGVHALGVLGSHVILAGEDEAVRVVSLTGDAALTSLAGPGGPVSALATHAGPGRLALAGAAGGISWREGLTEAPQALAGTSDVPARMLAFTEDGAGLVAGLDDGQVLLWRRLEDPAPLRLGRHRAPVRAAALAPGGGFMVTASDQGKLFFWDTDEGLLLQTQEAHEDRVTALAFLPDGRLASAGWDGTIRLLDLGGDGSVEVLKGHDGPVEGLVVHGERRLVSAGWDGWLRSWEL